MANPVPSLYVFQSGKYVGQPVEKVFEKDPSFLYWLYKKLEEEGSNGKKNRLEEALDDLFARAFSLVPSKICPFCRERKVKYFLLPYSGLIQDGLTCCDDDDCKKYLASLRPGRMLGISFAAIDQVERREAKKFVAFLKRVANVSCLI
jgi:hypothetical protein